MKIKISANSEELFDQCLSNVLNIACVCAMGGYLPTDDERQEPERRGKYWYRKSDDGFDRFLLDPGGNNHYAKVVEEGDLWITIEIRSRYPSLREHTASLSLLILSIFHGNTEAV